MEKGSEGEEDGTGSKARDKEAFRGKKDGTGGGAWDKESMEKRQDSTRGKEHKVLKNISFFKCLFASVILKLYFAKRQQTPGNIWKPQNTNQNMCSILFGQFQSYGCPIQFKKSKFEGLKSSP